MSLLPKRRDLIAGLAALAAAGRASAQEAPAAIPFRYHSSKVIVDVTINGRTVAAFLDTGATRTFLMRRLAEEMDLPERAAMVRSFDGTLTAAGRVVSVDLGVGGEHLPNLIAGVVEIEMSSLVLGERIGAVVGRDLFDRYRVALDFDTKKLTLTPTRIPPLMDAGPGTRLEPVEGLMGMPIQLGDGPPVVAAVDLGSDGNLVISPQLAAELNLLKDAKTSEHMLATAGGRDVVKLACLKDVKIGQRTFHGVPAWYPAAARYPLLIGAGLLTRFNLTFEFPRQRVWMKPNATLDAPFRKDVLGLTLAGGRWVIHVPPGSPAALAGIKVGDEVSGMDDRDLFSAISGPTPPIGRDLVVQFADGAKRTLTTAEYY